MTQSHSLDHLPMGDRCVGAFTVAIATTLGDGVLSSLAAPVVEMRHRGQWVSWSGREKKADPGTGSRCRSSNAPKRSGSRLCILGTILLAYRQVRAS